MSDDRRTQNAEQNGVTQRRKGAKTQRPIRGTRPIGPRRYSLILLILFCLLPAAASAQSLTRSQGLPSDAVTALAWQDDTLWVGSIAGLGRWNTASREASTVEFPLAEHHVLALYADEGALWVGTMEGVARLAGGSWQTWQRGEAGLASDWITSFASYQSALVAGSYGGGVLRWSGERWEPLGGDSPRQITALASQGTRLWAGTPRGLWWWEGGTWQREPLPVASARITALHMSENALWVGSDAGLFRQGGDGSWETLLVEPITALGGNARQLLAATEAPALYTAGEAQALTALDGAWNGGYISALLTHDNQLFVGTLGQGVIAAGEPLPEPSVSPLPVVLVHGLGDSDTLIRSNLRFLAQWLRQDGHTVVLAPSDERAPLLDNVATLRRVVAETKAASGAEEVLLIGHSFGGLVARAYLSSGATDVAGLATLGTPHAGARLAYDFLVSDLAQNKASDSEITLLPEHLALLAPWSELGGVPQLHIGGDRLPDGNLFAGFPPHDGIVSAASATAAPGATRILPLLHGWSYQTLAFGLDSLLWPDDIYVNTLRPWLQSVQRGEPWQDRAAAPPLAAPGFTSRPLLDRPLAPDELVTLSVPLDGQPATWFLQGEGVTLELVAPDGTRYPGERFLLGDQVAHLPYRDNVLQPLDLWSTRDEPGTWQATLHNTSAAPVAARLTLVEPLATPLDIVLEETWHAPGAAVLVEARGAASQTLFATLDGHALPMIELSPGQYRAVMTAPRARGYYALRVGNEQVERWGVIGVASNAWQVEEAALARDASNAALTLTIQGEGQVALGVRLMRGEEVLATRLVGPFRFRFPGEHALSVALPLPADSSGLRVEWQLFDQRDALVPATSINSLAIEE